MITFFKQNKSGLFQFLKITFLSGLVFLVSLFLIVSILAWVYRDNIKQRFVSEINKGLQTEVFIEDISLNVFRSFPFAAISLRNVVMLETPGSQPTDTLLMAKRIYFQFSILDLIRGNYKIRQAEIVSGFMNMKIFEDGRNNYAFWKYTTDDEDAVAFKFQLQRVLLNQIDYRFTDYADGHALHFSLDRAHLTGNFLRDNYLMSIRGDMLANEIIIDKAPMLSDRPVSFNFELDVVNNNIFTFREGVFKLGNHTFTASGSIDLSGQDVYLDLQIGAKQLRLENFVEDLPPQFARYLQGYRSKGELFFNATISGVFSSLIKPYISADFGIHDGELFHRKANLRFTGISFEGSFNNGQFRHLNSSTLSLEGFQAILNEGVIRMDGSLHNFAEPVLDVKLYSNIKADEWQRFLQIQKIRRAAGDLLIDIDFKGRLGENREFTKFHFMASQVKGTVTATDLSFALADDLLDYHSIFADLQFNNNDIVIRRFEGNASTSDFDMKGYFRNVLPWLFLENERLFVSATLASSNLNFNELLQYNVTESDTTYRLRLSEYIDFRLEAEVGKLAFKKFEAEQVKGSLSMREQVFYAGNISLNTMKGKILASGYINGKNEHQLVMGCEARIQDVDVYDLFFQFGNFGQQSIEYHNLRGRITADASIISRWSPFLEIDWNTLEVTANLKVENGELIDYKPMLALSRYIRVGDLNQVKFSTLENQIRIKNQVIIIPDMEINSNAINIKLSGEHTFENTIDYRLRVLLSDLLARRNRESRNPQEQYGDIIDDGLGRITLFLRVTGTIDDPVFRYDTQGVRDKLRDDFRQERQNLRQVLRTEFGLGRNDTLPDGSPVEPTERQQESDDIKKREQGKFIIEWDD
jgi:hypothetical protein